MKLYFAGPLFTTPERTWNADMAAALRASGHEVFLPQEKKLGLDAAGVFAVDASGIDSADVLVAIMDGPDPGSGTSWEVEDSYRLCYLRGPRRSSLPSRSSSADGFTRRFTPLAYDRD